MSRSLIPNSTQIPDVIIDEWMPHLSGAELAVIMFVARKTFGWGKTFDRISLSQMQEGTGLARSTVAKTCDDLARKKILDTRPADGRTAAAYKLNLDWEPADYTENRHSDCTEKATSSEIGTVPKIDNTVPKIGTVTVPKIGTTRDTLRNTRQETDEDKSSSSPAAPSRRFQPPDILEVRAFFSEKGRADLADEWWHYWDSCDWWRKKGVRMQKWRSAAAGWIETKASDKIARPSHLASNPSRNGVNIADSRAATLAAITGGRP